MKQTSKGVILLTLFLDLIGFSIIFPVYADLLVFYTDRDSGLLAGTHDWIQAQLPSATDGQVTTLLGAVLFSLFAGMQFLCAPLWGALSDRIGRRPVLLLTVSGNCLAYVLWAVAGRFELLLASRLIGGGMSGNLSVATAAMADITTDADRTKGMGLIGMSFGLGFLLGPAVGGLSYHFIAIPDPVEISWLQLTPFSGPALVAAVLSLLNVIWIARRFAETRPAGSTTGDRRTFNPLALLDSSLGQGVVRANCTQLLYILCFAGMESTLVFLAAQYLGYSPVDMAWLFVYFGLVGAFVQGGLIRRLSPRFADTTLIITGFIVQVPGYVCLALIPQVPTTWLIVLATSLLTIGSGLIVPALSALVSKRAAAEVQGRALGIFRSAGSLGRALGPLIAGLVYFAGGPPVLYYVAAATLVVPLVIVVSLRRQGAPA